MSPMRNELEEVVQEAMQTPEIPDELVLAFAPLHKRAFGMAIGTVLGALVFLVTVLATLFPEGRQSVALLAQYFLHVQDVDARHLIHELASEMLRTTDPAGRVTQFAGIGLGIRDKISRAVDGRVGTNDDNIRHDANERHRNQVA